MDVEGELSSDPLVPALPARPVQENIITVLRHVLDQVVCEPQVGRGQTQGLPELRVVDFNKGLVHLEEIDG